MPNRQLLAGRLLDEEHARCCRVRDHVLDEARKRGWHVVLTMDSAKNVEGLSQLNFLASTRQGTVLLDTGVVREHETSEFLAQQAMVVVREFGPFAAMVTDNCGAMQAARRAVAEQCPGLIEYPCSAHALSHLIEDVAAHPAVKEVIFGARDITHALRARPLCVAAFRDLRAARGTRALMVPVRHRWATQYQCVARVLENEETLRMLAVQRSLQLPQDVVHTCIMSDAWWRKAAAVADLLKPMAELISMAELEKPALASIYERCMYLRPHFAEVQQRHAGVLPAAVFGTCSQRLAERWLHAMPHRLLLLAYFLHPAFMGRLVAELSVADVLRLKAAVIAEVNQQVKRLFPDSPPGIAVLPSPVLVQGSTDQHPLHHRGPEPPACKPADMPHHCCRFLHQEVLPRLQAALLRKLGCRHRAAWLRCQRRHPAWPTLKAWRRRRSRRARLSCWTFSTAARASPHIQRGR